MVEPLRPVPGHAVPVLLYCFMFIAQVASIDTRRRAVQIRPNERLTEASGARRCRRSSTAKSGESSATPWSISPATSST